jgi:hypothetical protein
MVVGECRLGWQLSLQALIHFVNWPPLHWGALPATMTLVHKTIIMWDEIMDMPGEIFDFDAWIEEVASDPEFIAEVDKNNAQFDLEVSQLSV